MTGSTGFDVNPPLNVMGRVSLQRGAVDLRGTLSVSQWPDMNLLPRSHMLDVSAQTLYHMAEVYSWMSP